METEEQQPVESAVAKPEPVPAASAEAPQELRAEHPRRVPWRAILILCAVIVIVAALSLWRSRYHKRPEETATTVVGVAKVTRDDLFNEVPIPAEFRPYVEVELHAKVSGYVAQMNVDFGDKVRSNQLLATLEVPELHDQLRNAIAVQQRAEADYTNAHLMYQRLQDVSRQHPDLVAQQDLDTAQARDGSAFAAIAAAKADVGKYQTLVQYTQIAAPFDGVITGRYADPGALIQAGTAPESETLLRVSDNYHLRLDFPVSALYVRDIHLGDPVDARVDSLGGKVFTGTISRFTDKVTLDTRTMMVEVEIPNPNLEIVPGMYAALDLKVQSRLKALAIPLAALGGQRSSNVYVVNGNSEIEARQIKLGLETSTNYEVISGLTEGELVVVGNRAFVHPGQKVETKLVSQPAIP
jgi:RND family efflux transporter MFP subunit